MTHEHADDAPSLFARPLADHQAVLSATVATQGPQLDAALEALCRCLAAGNKVMFCGNGGSAADSQHAAAEFVNRARFDRPALAALALTVDSSVLTCVANDVAYEWVFARQVEALGRAGDVLVGISTSGASTSVLRALERARASGIVTIGLSGARSPNPMGAWCDHLVAVPSVDTARIQEAHGFVLHVLSTAVEERLCGPAAASQNTV